MQSTIFIGEPEDLSSPMTIFPLYCVYAGLRRGCWRNYNNIIRIKAANGGRISYVKVYTKTEAEWTLEHGKSFKTLLATSGSLPEFYQSLEEIFANREKMCIGDELQEAIIDYGTETSSQCFDPMPTPPPAPTPAPSSSSTAENLTVSYSLSRPATQSVHGSYGEPTWTDPQHASPRPHRPIAKGSLVNVLLRHSVADEANRRFQSVEALSSGSSVFELDVAYELQVKLRAHICKLENTVLESEGNCSEPMTPVRRQWY
ncbi:hypothetical protein FRC07_007595 [Ceratobasidium sp. 392]|nr:hypothetical protein FRC07_007595 [Ceratobasidium sp. 392]